MPIRTQKSVQHGVNLVFKPAKQADILRYDMQFQNRNNAVNSALFNDMVRCYGDGVVLEEENINTLTMTSEFMIALYGSFAQAESESISKNVSLGVQMAFREGKVRYQYKHWLGYCKDKDGNPQIITMTSPMSVRTAS